MTFRNSALAMSAAVLGILPSAGCGSDRSGVTTAPTVALPAVAVQQSVSAGARVTTLEDTGIAITSLVTSTSCPTLQFRISTYLIKTDAATTYSGGSCTSLQAGTKISLTATRIGADSDFVVYASQITIRTGTTSPIPAPAPTATPPLQADVTITSATGTCPDVTFLVGTSVFKVTSSTGYSGATCTDVKAGAKVSLVATKLHDGDAFYTVTGMAIKRGDTPPIPTTPTSPTSNTVTGEAAVTSLVTSPTACPALTFMVGGSYTVVASAATHYEGGVSCAAIKVGMKLALTGTRLGDTSIAAINIALNDGGSTSTAPTRPVEGAGVITSLSTGTGCPALQFSIGTYLIKLDAATQYVGALCSELKAGVKVHVKGAVNADGSVGASTITAFTEAPKPDPEVEGEGFVTGLVSGTGCPALGVHIGEYTVTLTASTQFAGGSCSSVAVGRKLSVRGTMNGEKTATASQITFKN